MDVYGKHLFYNLGDIIILISFIELPAVIKIIRYFFLRFNYFCFLDVKMNYLCFLFTGTQRHDLTSWMSFASVYEYIDARLRKTLTGSDLWSSLISLEYRPCYFLQPLYFFYKFYHVKSGLCSYEYEISMFYTFLFAIRVIVPLSADRWR